MEKQSTSWLKICDQDDKFELIVEKEDGKLLSAGLHEVPVVIVEADNLKSLELAIIENVQEKFKLN